MQLIKGKYLGFCKGVNISIINAENILKQEAQIYSLGEIVHNKNVLDTLTKKGLIIENDIEKIPENKSVIIRAHGIPQELYTKAKEKNIKLYDLTCPKVLSIHTLASKLSKDNFIILIANKTHPESRHLIVPTTFFA